MGGSCAHVPDGVCNPVRNVLQIHVADGVHVPDGVCNPVRNVLQIRMKCVPGRSGDGTAGAGMGREFGAAGFGNLSYFPYNKMLSMKVRSRGCSLPRMSSFRCNAPL